MSPSAGRWMGLRLSTHRCLIVVLPHQLPLHLPSSKLCHSLVLLHQVLPSPPMLQEIASLVGQPSQPVNHKHTNSSLPTTLIIHTGRQRLRPPPHPPLPKSPYRNPQDLRMTSSPLTFMRLPLLLLEVQSMALQCQRKT
jgi:hypothetical protein